MKHAKRRCGRASHAQNERLFTWPARRLHLRYILAPRMQQQKSAWAVALARDGGHDDCVKLLQEAHWPSGSSSIVGGRASGRSPPEEGCCCPCDGEQGEGSLREGPDREGHKEERRADEETRESVARETVRLVSLFGIAQFHRIRKKVERKRFCNSHGLDVAATIIRSGETDT